MQLSANDAQLAINLLIQLKNQHIYSHRAMNEQYDLKVEDTNEEALASKISAIKKGYINDAYAEEFTQYRGKRDIIIHRGYWARVHVVRRLVEKMIEHGQNIQIVALGSGLQTLWFNLMDQGFDKNKFRFIELDLEVVVKRKIRKIKHSKKINALIDRLKLTPSTTQHEHFFTLGDAYAIASCDLSSMQEFQKIIEDHKIDTTLPTLFYAQCVLSYIDADKVDHMVSFIKDKFNLAFLFDYEMYNPSDRFGQMMVKNFQMRGCPLVGMYKYPLLQNQSERYDKAGYKRTEVYTMLKIYYDCIDKTERLKIQKLEMLDELQEWNLIMAHYFGLLTVTYNQEGEKHKNFKELIENVKLK